MDNNQHPSIPRYAQVNPPPPPAAPQSFVQANNPANWTGGEMAVNGIIGLIFYNGARYGGAWLWISRLIVMAFCLAFAAGLVYIFFIDP